MRTSPRRPWLSSRWFVPALLAALALLPFLPALLGDGVFVYRDHLAHFLPKRALLVERLAGQGSLLWSAKISLGSPWLADPQNGAFYPPLPLLFGLLPFRVAYLLYPALHVALAGLGSYVLLRQLRCSRWAAFGGGLTLQWSGFVFSTIALTNNLSSFAWTPVALACGWRAAEETGRRFRWRVGTGVVLTLCLVAGEPQIAAFTALLTASLITLRGRARGRGPRQLLASVALVALVAAGLSAAQALPMLELTSLTRRADGVPWSRLERESLRPAEWIDLLSPAAFESGKGKKWHDSQAWLSTLYVGWLPIFFISWLRARQWRRYWPWLLPAFAGLALAHGTRMPGYGFLHAHAGFGAFRYPPRFLFLMLPSLAVLAGVGLDALRARLRKGELPVWRALLPALVAAALAALTLLHPEWPAMLKDHVAFGLGRGAVLAAAAGLVCVACSRRGLNRRLALGLLLGLTGADLWLYERPGFETAPLHEVTRLAIPPGVLAEGPLGTPARVLSMVPPEDRLAFAARERRDLNAHSRRRLGFLADSGAGLLGAADVSRDPIYPLVSHEPLHYALTELKSKKLATFLGVRTRVGLEGEAAAARIRYEDLAADPSPLRLALPTAGGQQPNQIFDVVMARGRQLIDGIPVPVDQLTSPWGPSDGQCAREGVVKLLGWKESSLLARVQLDCPAILVHASPLLPGWTARIDGAAAPVFAALGGLQAVWMPAGEHELALEYRPWSVRLGLGISSLTTLACLGLLGLGALRRKE